MQPCAPRSRPTVEHRRSTRWTDDLRPPEHLAKRLTDAGVRPTPIRCDVLAVLHGEPVPHSAAEVFRRIVRPGFALANVYRILAELEAAGLVERSVPEARRASVFSIRSVIQSGHLACVKCHAVEAVADEWMQARLQSLAEAKGLVLQRHSWRMLGWCRSCAAAEGARSGRGASP